MKAERNSDGFGGEFWNVLHDDGTLRRSPRPPRACERHAGMSATPERAVSRYLCLPLSVRAIVLRCMISVIRGAAGSRRHSQSMQYV